MWVVLLKVLKVACGCSTSRSGVDFVIGIGVKHLEIVEAYDCRYQWIVPIEYGHSVRGGS